MTRATASNFADLMAIARRKEAERDAVSMQDSALNQIAPVFQVPPISQVAPTQQTPPAPTSLTPPPLSVTPPVSQTAPVSQKPAGYTRLTHDVADRLLPTLDTYSQSVLVRLLRLTWGFQSDVCRVGLKSLANHCNISESQTRRAVRTLIARDIIAELGTDFSNSNQSARGTEYRILLIPAPTHGTGGVSRVAPSRETGATRETPIKKNTLKETHTNTVGVRVSSRFTLQECRKYAESLRTDGITNPGGYATKIHRSGEADDLIAAFLEPVEVTKPIDVSQCLDCAGTGWRHPNGVGGGVVKCKHENLVERLESHS